MPIRDTLFAQNQNRKTNSGGNNKTMWPFVWGAKIIKVWLWFHIKLSEEQNKGMHWDDTDNNKDTNYFGTQKLYSLKFGKLHRSIEKKSPARRWISMSASENIFESDTP